MKSHFSLPRLGLHITLFVIFLPLGQNTKPIILSNKNIFSSQTYETATLHVPLGCQSVYKATSPWNNFYIAETDFTDISDVRTDKKGTDVFYDLNGRVVKNPTKGVYIVNGKKVLGASKK